MDNAKHTKNFAVFMYDIGFAGETIELPVVDFDVSHVVNYAYGLEGTKPYAFYFVTKEFNPTTFSIENTRMTNMYYLGGTVLRLQDVPHTKEYEILRSNMEINKVDKVVVTRGGGKTLFVSDDAIILDFFPEKG